jgi:methylated-DNA-[protein]-cysteine S-methyltransferase
VALYCSSYETAWGTGGVVASDAGLVTVVLPDRAGIAAIRPQLQHWSPELRPSRLSEAAADLLRRYFAGEQIVCDLPLDGEGWSPFRRQIYRETMAIPYGEVRSYGQLAHSCGRPGAARAVGRLMGANQLPIIIPCHRVVAASGALTGYSAPGGLQFKAELLELEGVRMSPRQRVCR